MLSSKRKSSSPMMNNVATTTTGRSPGRLRLPVFAASRMLKKRFSSAAEILKSTDFWLHTTPSKNCDIVVTFPPNTNEYTVMWILTRLRTRLPDLEVHLRKLKMTDVFGLYITSTYDRILREAESLRIRKRLEAEYGGGLQEFIFERAHRYEGIADLDTFLSSQERQSIVLNMLYSLRATEEEELNGVKFVDGQAIVPKCLSEGIISQVFPLHNNDCLQYLRQIWVQAFLKPQPLDTICDYYGVKIAMYFAWLGHYTTALTIPAVFGFILWICFYENQAAEDICFVLFAFFNVIWTTLYLESWKRRQAELAYRWGTLDRSSELLQEPRPLFRGPYVKSPITGLLEPTYPNWKRNVFRYCVSVPVMMLCLGLACITIFSIFELELWWIRRMEKLDYPSWLMYMPKILMALAICAMDETYHWIASHLNNMENYRLEEAYENHLTIKMGVFQFVSAFVSLFYIAFYLQDMEKLRYLLATLLITRQVVGNIKESFVPFIAGHLKLLLINLQVLETPVSSPVDAGRPPNFDNTNKKSEKRSSDSDKINVSQAELESGMFPYEGTFEDYLEMFIQFGYVMLFSSAFPMAAACALLNNLIEIRSDAFKLCCSLQRPFGVRVANIGAWQTMMEVMGVIAITVNCALIGMSGQVQRIFPEMSTTGTIILIIALEHLMLAIKYGLSHAIPDVPAWVAIEMAKVEYKRREALRELDPFSDHERSRKFAEGRNIPADIDLHVTEPDSRDGTDGESFPDDVSQDSEPVFEEQKDSSSSEIDVNHQNTKTLKETTQAPSFEVIGPNDNFASNLFTDTQQIDTATSETELRHRKTDTVQNSSTKISLPFFGLQKHHLKIPSPLKLVRRKSTGGNSPSEVKDEKIEETEQEEEPLLKTSEGGRRFSLFLRGKHGK